MNSAPTLELDASSTMESIAQVITSGILISQSGKHCPSPKISTESRLEQEFVVSVISKTK